MLENVDKRSPAKTLWIFVHVCARNGAKKQGEGGPAKRDAGNPAQTGRISDDLLFDISLLSEPGYALCRFVACTIHLLVQRRNESPFQTCLRFGSAPCERTVWRPTALLLGSELAAAGFPRLPDLLRGRVRHSHGGHARGNGSGGQSPGRIPRFNRCSASSAPQHRAAGPSRFLTIRFLLPHSPKQA